MKIVQTLISVFSYTNFLAALVKPPFALLHCIACCYDLTELCFFRLIRVDQILSKSISANFTLHVAQILQNVASAVFIMHVENTLRNSFPSVFCNANAMRRSGTGD